MKKTFSKSYFKIWYGDFSPGSSLLLVLTIMKLDTGRDLGKLSIQKSPLNTFRRTG